MRDISELAPFLRAATTRLVDFEQIEVGFPKAQPAHFEGGIRFPVQAECVPKSGELFNDVMGAAKIPMEAELGVTRHSVQGVGRVAGYTQVVAYSGYLDTQFDQFHGEGHNFTGDFIVAEEEALDRVLETLGLWHRERVAEAAVETLKRVGRQLLELDPYHTFGRLLDEQTLLINLVERSSGSPLSLPGKAYINTRR